MTEKIRLALVDDDQLVVELLVDFFDKKDDFDVCMTASGGHSFLEQLQNSNVNPAIVLLDLKMENGDGLHVIEALKKDFPEIRIVVLSSHARTAFIGQMTKLGVNAFLPKKLNKEDLLQILKDVIEKGFYFTLEQIDVLRNQITVKSPKLSFDESGQLTEREIEVLTLICQQLTTKEIATKLFVSVKAIESRKSSLMLKLGVKNMAGLIIAAIKYKLVDPETVSLIN